MCSGALELAGCGVKGGALDGDGGDEEGLVVELALVRAVALPDGLGGGLPAGGRVEEVAGGGLGEVGELEFDVAEGAVLGEACQRGQGRVRVWAY